MFNPMEIARGIIMRRVSRGPVHYGIAVECVRVSDVNRLVSGYDAFHSLVQEGKLTIDSNGILRDGGGGHE